MNFLLDSDGSRGKEIFNNKARIEGFEGMKNHNPNIDEFLRFYSQSNSSTGGTRGYDPKTYVETKLDEKLTPSILNPQTKLVILSGNAGDGKTAYIQRFESLARAQGAEQFSQTDNGCSFILNGVAFQTLYDGNRLLVRNELPRRPRADSNRLRYRLHSCSMGSKFMHFGD